MLQQARQRASRAVANLEQKKQERDWLEKLTPAPTAENEAAIVTAVEEARETLRRLRDEAVGGAVTVNERAPVRPVDSLFALTEFSEEMRRKATEARVALKPQESFGFASHVHEGPSIEAIPTVHRQQCTVRELLDLVFAVRPQALLAVSRERPFMQEEGGGAAGRADFFAPAPALLLRQPGLIETDAFRLEFTGQTDVLRDFLAALANLSRPVLVRSVEVESLKNPLVPSHENGPAIVAKATPSKFIVALEVPVFTADTGEQVRMESAAPRMAGSIYASEAVSAPIAPETIWARPAASTAGDWACDLFTPPDVLFDEVTGLFVAARSAAPVESVARELPPLQLLSVKQEVYRLQLAGYFGEAADYLGAFVSSQSAETLLAKTGHRFASLGLTLKNFDVRTVPLGENEAGPVYEAAALAVLHDEQTGAEVVLDSRRLLFTGNLLAVFRLPGGTGAARELREGDSFTTSDAVYRIERIQLEPAEVVVSRSKPTLPVPELQVLRPVAQTTAGSRRVVQTSQSEQRVVARHD